MALLSRRRVAGSERVVRTTDGVVLARVPDEVGAEMENLWVRLRVHQPSLPASVLLTAKLSGEGVSLVSLALGTVAAGVGRTLVVEANDLGGRLPVAADRPGLTDVLMGAVTIDEAVVATDQPGLDVLPVGAGAVPGRLGSSLDMITAGDLVDALEASYDLVLVDSPGLAQSALALTLAGACEASLLVVRHGVTDIDQVQSARAALGQGANLLGVVLNGTHLATPGRIRRLLGSDA